LNEGELNNPSVYEAARLLTTPGAPRTSEERIMGWNTALDGNGITYYWHTETAASQYEVPPDFDAATAQSAGSYSQYANASAPASAGYSSQAPGAYGNGAQNGYGNSYGSCYASNYDPHAGHQQYSQSRNTGYKDVQDAGVDLPANEAVAAFWKKNDLKVYGGSPPPFLTFEDAKLPPAIMDSIARAGFPSPSVIQSQTWPAAMAKRDVIGVAKTGSGKTLGFLIPGFLHILTTRPNPMAGPALLVLAPTRELAVQIEVECQKFGLPIGIKSVCCYGGSPKGEQLAKMRQGCSVVIGTPGRINDFREGGQIQLLQVSFLVMTKQIGCWTWDSNHRFARLSPYYPFSARRYSTRQHGHALSVLSHMNSSRVQYKSKWATSIRSMPTRISRNTCIS